MDEATDDRRWLVFRGPSRGQGVGSLMHGVAAALVLGVRHTRRVCVSWRAFELAFHAPAWRCPSKEALFRRLLDQRGPILEEVVV